MAIPANPRDFNKLAYSAGNVVLGGSPGEGCSVKNRSVYPAGDYTVDATPPQIRVFDGVTDRGIASIPATLAGAMSDAIVSMIAANGTVYLTTLDTGTTSADWTGRVFQFNPDSGDLTQLGAAFGSGEVPYALAWHMGRLWVGTNNTIGTVGKVYFFRPDIDTSWTMDQSLSKGVCSMLSYKGKLYIGCDSAAASFALLEMRDDAGAYTTSLTATGGTARVNNGFLSLCEFGGNLYAGYFNNDTTKVAKIYKFDNASWTNPYSGSGTTLAPYIHMFTDLDAVLYIVGGGLLIQGVLLSTIDGSSFTDLSAQLLGSATCLPLHAVLAL
jgi:hypothetical protein